MWSSAFSNLNDPAPNPASRSRTKKIQAAAPSLNLSSPKDVYTALIQEINTLFSVVGSKEDDESAQISAAKQQCHDVLGKIRGEVDSKIRALENNAEWNEFTIAFYGETNAGNGINVTGLVGALVGGALLWWNPGGWAIMAAGIATVLVGAWKAVRSFFSSDYKKQQQREAADKNIRNVGYQVDSSASSAACEAIDKIKEQLHETEKSLKEPIHAMTFVSEALENSAQSLTALSRAVQTQAIA